MDYSKESLKVHEENKGKIEVRSKIKVQNSDDLSVAYTPGVAEPCRKINQRKEDVYKYTSKGNLVAVVTDGTAVLGLGDIGPESAMPVMEGKSILFKIFANVDAFPICLDTKDVDKIVETVKLISPTFGGINLEDISAPRCVEIEKRLKKELNIPVFHDDQHGTAIVVSAGIINALKIVNKKIENVKIVINGAGAAGSAIAKMLLSLGVKKLLVCDREGILNKNNNKNWLQEELANLTNKDNVEGTLKDAMVGADIFIGVSAGNIVNKEMVKSMNSDAIVFAMANPIPEIFPDEAKLAGARIVGTGRSDYANQINNVLAFPGLFRGALDARASEINDEMNIAAAYAIANMVKEFDLCEDFIIPNALNKEIAVEVAKAVEEAARKTGVAQI
ncbi:NAD(P)-dependent malic enzyme [Oceanivirga salmonicida]|uniref:NAD(P)-dependent malic enzyme n=1 Tax=Oceanivirga salmonicida TaxID=1769291 RepID=UPI00083440A9|nr:NADP-dependent malic enzyme [Oceanivirga salmonicida]